MDVHERINGDRDRLQQLIGAESNAAQRDRYRAVALAIDGRRADEIMTMLERSRAFVQRWVYAYRDGGVSAIAARTPTGRPAKLSPTQLQALRERLEAGPTDDDNVCAFRGRDVQQLIEREYGVRYSLNGVYDVLHRHGYSWLAPRPQHRQADPHAQQAFKASAPLLSKTSG